MMNSASKGTAPINRLTKICIPPKKQSERFPNEISIVNTAKRTKGHKIVQLPYHLFVPRPKVKLVNTAFSM